MAHPQPDCEYAGEMSYNTKCDRIFPQAAKCGFYSIRIEYSSSRLIRQRGPERFIRPVVSRKKRGFSARFWPGGAVPPPRVSPFSKVKRFIRLFCKREREENFSRGAESSLPLLCFIAGRADLEHFQFETLCVSNHTACRFAEKTQFFRSLLAGRRGAVASPFAFFKGRRRYSTVTLLARLRG